MNIMQHVLQVTKGLALLTGVLGVSALVGTPAMADTSTTERNLAQTEFPSDSTTITPATTTPTTIDVQVPVETAPAQTDTNVVVPVEVPSTTDSSTTDDSSTIPSTIETVPSRIEVTPRVNPPVDSPLDTQTGTPAEGQIQVVPSPAQTDVVVPIDTPTDTTGSDVTPVTPTTPTDLDGAQLPVREFQVSQSSEGMTDPSMPSTEETPSSEDLGYPATETPSPESPGYEVETPGYEESPMMEMPGEETNEADMLPETDAEESAATGNIVETAVSSGSFDTLVQAIEAAGLSETLTGEGPYTVFAPTDEAFAALPPGVLNALLLPENQGLLARILTYHVASGELTSDQIATGAVETVDGGAIAVRVTDDNQVIVNDGSVIQADIVASNGIIHAINRVLLPPDIQEQLGAFPK